MRGMKRWFARDENGLWPVHTVLVLTAGGVIGVGVAVMVVAAAVLNPHGAVTISEYVDFVTVGVGLLIGGGGGVALVVAYRRQKINELGEQRLAGAEGRESIRLLNERFQQASAQLGYDKPAVRLAGAYAMANLADDWNDHGRRQMCIDVLCAYVRMPVDVRSGSFGPNENDPAWRAGREVHHTILRIIAAHLRPDGSEVSWHHHVFDLRGVVLDIDHLDFHEAELADERIDMRGATVESGVIDFSYAKLLDADEGGYSAGVIDLSGATFNGGLLDFANARIGGGAIRLVDAEINDGDIHFGHTLFFRGRLVATDAVLNGGSVSFYKAQVDGPASLIFRRTTVKSGAIAFLSTTFNGVTRGTVTFEQAKLEGGAVTFTDSSFKTGNQLSFREAGVSGSLIDFSQTTGLTRLPEGLEESDPGVIPPNTAA